MKKTVLHRAQQFVLNSSVHFGKKLHFYICITSTLPYLQLVSWVSLNFPRVSFQPEVHQKRRKKNDKKKKKRSNERGKYLTCFLQLCNKYFLWTSEVWGKSKLFEMICIMFLKKFPEIKSKLIFFNSMYHKILDAYDNYTERSIYYLQIITFIYRIL